MSDLPPPAVSTSNSSILDSLISLSGILYNIKKWRNRSILTIENSLAELRSNIQNFIQHVNYSEWSSIINKALRFDSVNYIMHYASEQRKDLVQNHEKNKIHLEIELQNNNQENKQNHHQKVIPLVSQGNIEFYSSINILSRQSLLFNINLLNVTKQYWQLFLLNHEGKLEFEEYFQLFILIYRVLIPDSNNSANHYYKALQSIQVIESDWKTDCEASGALEIKSLTFPAFHVSLFNLCDHWTFTVNLTDYTDLLLMLFSKITMNNSPVDKHNYNMKDKRTRKLKEIPVEIQRILQVKYRKQKKFRGKFHNQILPAATGINNKNSTQILNNPDKLIAEAIKQTSKQYKIQNTAKPAELQLPTVKAPEKNLNRNPPAHTMKTHNIGFMPYTDSNYIRQIPVAEYRAKQQQSNNNHGPSQHNQNHNSKSALAQFLQKSRQSRHSVVRQDSDSKDNIVAVELNQLPRIMLKTQKDTVEHRENHLINNNVAVIETNNITANEAVKPESSHNNLNHSSSVFMDSTDVSSLNSHMYDLLERARELVRKYKQDLNQAQDNTINTQTQSNNSNNAIHTASHANSTNETTENNVITNETQIPDLAWSSELLTKYSPKIQMHDNQHNNNANQTQNNENNETPLIASIIQTKHTNNQSNTLLENTANNTALPFQTKDKTQKHTNTHKTETEQAKTQRKTKQIDSPTAAAATVEPMKKHKHSKTGKESMMDSENKDTNQNPNQQTIKLDATTTKHIRNKIDNNNKIANNNTIILNSPSDENTANFTEIASTDKSIVEKSTHKQQLFNPADSSENLVNYNQNTRRNNTENHQKKTYKLDNAKLNNDNTNNNNNHHETVEADLNADSDTDDAASIAESVASTETESSSNNNISFTTNTSANASESTEIHKNHDHNNSHDNTNNINIINTTNDQNYDEIRDSNPVSALPVDPLSSSLVELNGNICSLNSSLLSSEVQMSLNGVEASIQQELNDLTKTLQFSQPATHNKLQDLLQIITPQINITQQNQSNKQNNQNTDNGNKTQENSPVSNPAAAVEDEELPAFRPLPLLVHSNYNSNNFVIPQQNNSIKEPRLKDQNASGKIQNNENNQNHEMNLNNDPVSALLALSPLNEESSRAIVRSIKSLEKLDSWLKTDKQLYRLAIQLSLLQREEQQNQNHEEQNSFHNKNPNMMWNPLTIRAMKLHRPEFGSNNINPATPQSNLHSTGFLRDSCNLSIKTLISDLNSYNRVLSVRESLHESSVQARLRVLEAKRIYLQNKFSNWNHYNSLPETLDFHRIKNKTTNNLNNRTIKIPVQSYNQWTQLQQSNWNQARIQAKNYQNQGNSTERKHDNSYEYKENQLNQRYNNNEFLSSISGLIASPRALNLKQRNFKLRQIQSATHTNINQKSNHHDFKTRNSFHPVDDSLVSVPSLSTSRIAITPRLALLLNFNQTNTTIETSTDDNRINPAMKNNEIQSIKLPKLA